MDTLLVTVTALSLLMAVVMGGMLARLLREERRRSDARVALLEELAAEPEPPVDRAVLRPPVPAVRQPRPSRPVPREREAPLDAFELHPPVIPGTGAADRPDLFRSDEEPSAWPRRLALMASMAALLLVIGLGWNALQPAEPARRAPSASRAAFQPLELLSLRHSHENGILTITGLVQNPRSAAALTRVEATVLVFDRSGAMLTSGRAPLDFTTLAAGDESPFVIRVPVSGTVARYRVGFRGSDGTVLAHVDRRNADSVAQKVDP
ncbi:MAG TPA: hypothetical protein VM364_04995 [Vicinamibacterales bacterium]|nr:hypothetical protein [Vicinamibacterales bacterium]